MGLVVPWHPGHLAEFAPPLVLREPNHHSPALGQKAAAAIRPMNQCLDKSTRTITKYHLHWWPCVKALWAS